MRGAEPEREDGRLGQSQGDSRDEGESRVKDVGEPLSCKGRGVESRIDGRGRVGEPGEERVEQNVEADDWVEVGGFGENLHASSGSSKRVGGGGGTRGGGVLGIRSHCDDVCDLNAKRMGSRKDRLLFFFLT